MKILFCTSESSPFIKSGGLGDVAYALPKELKRMGQDIRVIMPLYKKVKEKYKDQLEHVVDFNVRVSYRNQYCGIERINLDGIIYYFIDNMYYFDRDNLYGYIDDGERFSYFCLAAIEALEKIEFIPDVMHVNDWHTSIIPLLLKIKYPWISSYRNIKTVLTIHNLKFQGIFPREVLGELLSLGDGVMHDYGVEFYGNVNYLKGGINFSDFITTVSPSYANEIKDPFYGENLDGLLRRVDYKLKGILNGIDEDTNNPKTDKDIPYNYDSNSIENKKKNKYALLKKLNLPQDDKPLIAIISRLTDQKGFDILAYGFEELLNKDVRVVVVGTGEKKYEDMFRYFSNKYRDKLSSNILFDTKFAQEIYGAADFILVPSLFEPCGLTQLIAMRYGTIPIVRETGGLRDTVVPFNKYTKEGTGFTFTNYNHMDLLGAIDRALEAYNCEDYKILIKNAMAVDSSWSKSTVEYLDLYKSLTNFK